MEDTDKKAPYATKVLRKGLPILDRNLKELIEEIQNKANIACKESKGTTAEEIIYEINKEVQNFEIGNQEEMIEKVEDLVFTLKAKIPNIPENKRIFQKIEIMKSETDIVNQYSILSDIISMLPQVQVTNMTQLNVTITENPQAQIQIGSINQYSKNAKDEHIMSKSKVLFLASNPEATNQLSLDEEIRQITLKIRASEYRDSIDLVSAWAVRPDDLLQMLNQHKPQIVHFSGHGNTFGEIILTSDSGESIPVSNRALKALFTILKDNLKVVVLNCCYSKEQAEAITEVIDCAVGMNDAIGDKAAITFAASFYRAIGFGRSVKEAFDQGKVALLLENIPEENTPELLVKDGVDPSHVMFLGLDDELYEITRNKREIAGKIIEKLIKPLRNCAKEIKSNFENGNYIRELESNSIILKFKYTGYEFIDICENSGKFYFIDNNLDFIYKKDEILNKYVPKIITYLGKYKEHFLALKAIIESLSISNIPTFFENDIAILIEDRYAKNLFANKVGKEENLFKLYATVIIGKESFSGHSWAVDLKREKPKEVFDIIKKDPFNNETIFKIESLKNEIIMDINKLIAELNYLDNELQNKYYL